MAFFSSSSSSKGMPPEMLALIANQTRAMAAQATSGKLQIKLPTKHKCDEGCKFTDMTQKKVSSSWNSKTQSCNKQGEMSDHNCPPLVSCEAEEMWAPQGEFQRPDELVIPDPVITLHITYPLRVPVDVPVTHEGGFTRKQLVRAILAEYKRIYAEEAATSGPPSNPSSSNSTHLSLNRPQTNGKYGIWGHEIDDLVLERIYYDPASKKVTFFIGS